MKKLLSILMVLSLAMSINAQTRKDRVDYATIYNSLLVQEDLGRAYVEGVEGKTLVVTVTGTSFPNAVRYASLETLKSIYAPFIRSMGREVYSSLRYDYGFTHIKLRSLYTSYTARISVSAYFY